MRGIAGEVDALHARMRRQPGRDFAGVGALPLHAQPHGFDAAHGQIAFKRAQVRTEGARKDLDGIEMLAIRDDDSAQHVAVPGHVFRRAVDHDARAQFQRPDQQRRREGVVDDQRRVRSFSRSPRSYPSRPRAAADWRPFPSPSRRAWIRLTAASSAARSHTSTQVDLHAHAARRCSSAGWWWRRTARWRRPRVSGRSISAARIARCSALIPEAHATAPWPPSRSFTSSSSALVVGLS